MTPARLVGKGGPHSLASILAFALVFERKQAWLTKR